MFSRIFRSFGGALLCVALMGGAFSAHAQNLGLGGFSKEELRGHQAQLFDKLLEEPDNLDLMFEYSQVSIRLEDYEAAISTLERMLIYRQDLSRVRLELAVAYFNLGSYAASELYFDQVLADDQTPDNVRARINRYKEAIAFRTRTSAWSVLANVGITHSTNATLGPDSNLVLVGGGTANVINGAKQSDTGLRVIVNLSHVYDLQQEDDDIWKTDLNFYSVRYFDSTAGNVIFGRVRSGPRLSLDEKQFGPKVRPYVEAQYLNSADRGLFGAFGVGAEISDTLSPLLSAFGDVGFRYRNYFRQEFSDEDHVSFYATGGLAYIPYRDLVIRGAAIFEVDEADQDQNSNIELGLRVSGEYQYDTGIPWVDRKWSIAGYAEVRRRAYDQPDPAVAPTITRRDVDVRAGLRHIFTLQHGFGIQVDVDSLWRESNIVNFELDNLSTTVSLQYRM